MHDHAAWHRAGPARRGRIDREYADTQDRPAPVDRTSPPRYGTAKNRPEGHVASEEEPVSECFRSRPSDGATENHLLVCVGCRGPDRKGEAHVSRGASAASPYVRGLGARGRRAASRVPEGGAGRTISIPHMTDTGRFSRNGDGIRPGLAAAARETPAAAPAGRGYAPYDLIRSSMALSSSSHTR